MSVTRFQRNFDQTYPFSNTCMQTFIGVETAISWTVPGVDSQIYRARFSVRSNSDVWLCLNGTAIVPSSDVISNIPYQERISEDYQRYVKGGDTLSFISTTSTQIGVSLLQVQDIT